MNNGFNHTEEAIKQRGEVFTPTTLVNEMLDKLPKEVFHDKDKTFLDNSCGNGQFLFQVMKRKIEYMMKKLKMSLVDAHLQALSTIYGVELDQKNYNECKKRLMNGVVNSELKKIINHNIICADALDQNHPGWSGIGFYWDENIQPIIPPIAVVEYPTISQSVPFVSSSVDISQSIPFIAVKTIPREVASSIEEFTKNILTPTELW